MALSIEQIDNFVDSIHLKFAGEEKLAAQDLSLPLQEYKYASRLFSGNLKKDTMSTSQCKWKVKVNTNDNFQTVGLYHRDSSTRVMNQVKEHGNGEIKNFTGISDPYEEPKNPELNIDTNGKSVLECCEIILNRLFKLNILKDQRYLSEPSALTNDGLNIGE